jgi:hypothetical protein
MLYQRYGKEKLESVNRNLISLYYIDLYMSWLMSCHVIPLQQMKLLFGNNSSKSEEGNNELSFAEYLKAVSVRMPRKGAGRRPITMRTTHKG